MTRPLKAAAVWAGSLVALCACNVLRPAQAPQPGVDGVAPQVQHPRLELRQSPSRPAVARVDRRGDPRGAVAIAIAHDQGSVASVALMTLLQARLPKGRVVVARPHDLGVYVATLVEGAEDARTFARAALMALRTPVGETDPALAKVAERTAQLAKLGAAEGAVSRCTGELGATVPDTRVSPAALENWRVQAARAGAVSLAALGTPEILDGVTEVVEQSGDWPSGGPEDPWPTESVTASLGGEKGSRQLSVALRLQSGARTIAAARALGGAAAPRLAARLASLSLAWEPEQITATTRPRGACLRVDLRTGSDERADPEELAWAAWAVERELRAIVAETPDDWWAVEDGVLRATDPREAAAIAAWRALSGRHPAGTEQRFVRYSGPKAEPLAAALSQVERRASSAVIDHRSQVEAGQGELWMLLASPCATLDESDADAGATALALGALSARARSLHPAIAFEPWLTADGAGLLVHAPRKDAEETATAQAERVADALGHALVAPLDERDVAVARTTLLEQLGSSAPYWVAMDALSAGHPSWLEPRGTHRAVSNQPGQLAETRRKLLLADPVRLAVLANSSPAQGEIAAQRLAHWFAPSRGKARDSCPRVKAVAAKRGELVVESVAERDQGRSWVGVSLPSGAVGEARWLEHLLNRPTGLLDRAIVQPGLGSARARVLGGRRHAALLIEVSHFPETESDALAQVRALLGRLAQGALDPRDFTQAERHLHAEDRERAVDPRERIVSLWSGSRPPSPTLASLTSFLRLALRPEAHLVVSVKN